MKLNFRQGLISFQSNGSVPDFLAGAAIDGYVDLKVAPTPFFATIAHGNADYLVKFDAQKYSAFGPLVAGPTNYFYVGIDLLTGEVQTGVTQLEPVVSAIEPSSPVAGQHWFDLNDCVMKVRNPTNLKWLATPRIFVGKAVGGSTTQLVGYITGSGVGLNVPCQPGYVLYDAGLRPVRTATGTLLTTDTPMRAGTTVGTSGVLSNSINNFVPVRAGENLPPMSLVYFSDVDTVELASSLSAVASRKAPVGLVEYGLNETEVGTLTQTGEITYDQWDWTGHAGEALWCDTQGQLTTTRPVADQAYRVGTVKNNRTILLDILCESTGGGGGGTGNGTLTTITGVSPLHAQTSVDLTTVTLTVDQASTTAAGVMTPSQVVQLNGLDARITTNATNITSLQVTKANANHNHVITDVAGLQADLASKLPLSGGTMSGFITLAGPPTIDLHAATKGYVDSTVASIVSANAGFQTQLNGKLNISGGSMTGPLSLFGNPVNSLDAASKQYVDTTTATITAGVQTSLDGKLNLTGGTMSGFITLNGAPLVPLHAATKQYVDSALSGSAYTAGTGVTINAGAISIGQPVATTSNPVFNNISANGNVVVQGNLTVTGTTTTVASASLDVGNASISLLNLVTGAPTQNAQFGVNRGTSPEVALRWNEALDQWEFTNDGLIYHKMITGLSDLGATTYTDAQADLRVIAGIAGSSINALADVDTAAPAPTDGQVLTWVAASSMWKPRATSSSVTSVNGFSGVVTLSTSNITEGTNQYFTQGRVRTAISATAPISYDSITGIISAAGLGTVSSVSGSGGTTGLTLTGGPITTNGTLTLGGTLAITNGGTGAGTVGGALTNLLPTQTGNGNKVLTTDGTNATWATVSAANVLPAITGNSGKYLGTDGTTISWTAFSANAILPAQAGHATQVLTTDGTNSTWAAISASTLLPSQAGNTGKALITNGTTAAWTTIAIDSVLPAQTGNIGKVLTTDGTSASWGSVSASSASNLLAGAVGQIPFQSAASTTAFSTNLTWTNGTSTLLLGGTATNTTITTGAADTLTLNSSALMIKTGAAERLRILANGAWSVGAAGTATGTTGQVLMSTGGTTAPAWTSLPGGLSAAGATGTVQVVGAGGALAAGNGIYTAPTTTFTGQATGGGLAIRSAAGVASWLDLGRATSEAVVAVTGAAAQHFTGSTAGDLVLRSSTAAVRLGYSSAGTTAPTLTLDTSGNAIVGQAGYVSLVSGSAEHLRVLATGAISVGSTGTTTGTVGQVLTSGGAAASPTWKDNGEFMVVALSDETTAIAAGTAKVTFRAPYAMTLYQIPRVSLSTAGTTASAVDIKVNGTSILGTAKLTLDANEKTSTTAAVLTTLATSTIADDAEFTLDIVTAGTGAKGLKLVLYYART